MTDVQTLSPREIVLELDKYIIGQHKAKRAMAIALRNRWRRQQVPKPLRDEIAPKNILMIGPTGVGKTEIARRLAKLSNAPFVKVEATKFTEVGYVGKDVESMIRELVDLSIKMSKETAEVAVKEKARANAEERLLDLLLPKKPRKKQKPTQADSENPMAFLQGLIENSDQEETDAASSAELPNESQENVSEARLADEEEKTSETATRDKLRELLHAGKLEKRLVELDTNPGKNMPMVEIVAAGGMEDIGANIRDVLSQMMPREKKHRRVTVADARELLILDEAQKLIDMDQVVKLAIENVEQNGIVFLDELDKVCSRNDHHSGGEVSREGVQRDLLPIVEGSNVATKHGMVRTDHILFVAAGAFHVAKPSDLIPELQGRFPIRVELEPLTESDFLRILTEPENSLVKQYEALMKTEGVTLTFEQSALEAIARYSANINLQTENIGARRLHTVLERVLETISFEASDKTVDQFRVDAAYVDSQLESIVSDQDLSRYIL